MIKWKEMKWNLYSSYLLFEGDHRDGPNMGTVDPQTEHTGQHEAVRIQGGQVDWFCLLAGQVPQEVDDTKHGRDCYTPLPQNTIGLHQHFDVRLMDIQQNTRITWSDITFRWHLHMVLFVKAQHDSKQNQDWNFRQFQWPFLGFVFSRYLCLFRYGR